MLRKIISGGQTGADQAALDSAIKFNIEYGGWVPKGRKTEQGALLPKYKMNEMTTADYRVRTQQNIIDSDATLIIAGGNLTGGTLLTKKIAKEMDKPYCHIDYISMDDFEAAMLVHSFIVDNDIDILNVAGPRISNDAGIYEGVRTIMEALIYMVELASGKGIEKVEFISFNNEEIIIPDNMDGLVKELASKLTLKTKTTIAILQESKISSLYFELSDYIMDKYIFNPDNTISFKQYVNDKSEEPCNTMYFFKPENMIRAGDFTMEIVKRLKKFLEKDHVLRIVK